MTPPREGPRARTPPTYSLAAEELHEAMAGDNVVRDDAFNVQVVDGGRHSPRSEDVPSAEVVDELQLERLQNEEPSVRRQGAVRGRPQDAGVDDADVEEPPEEVLPPTPASTPHHPRSTTAAGPVGRHSSSGTRLRELVPCRARRPAEVGVGVQQVDGREVVVRVEVMLAQEVATHQRHHNAVAEVEIDRSGCCVRINSKC